MIHEHFVIMTLGRRTAQPPAWKSLCFPIPSKLRQVTVNLLVEPALFIGVEQETASGTRNGLRIPLDTTRALACSRIQNEGRTNGQKPHN